MLTKKKTKEWIMKKEEETNWIKKKTNRKQY